MKKLFISITITCTTLSFASAQNLLQIPDTLSGFNFNLEVLDSSKQFYSGFNTNTMGINTNYLGPTLILQKGDSIQLNVTNSLTDTTTIHWHGMHVSPMNDGGPHNTIAPGSTWSPSFTVRDNAATYWYHPHLHMMTNMHATMGAAGVIIVRDNLESSLAIPRKYGVDDFPIVIQSKCFDSNKQIVIDNHSDSVVMVNGTLDPFLPAPSQIIRLRVLNASSDRNYRIGFNNNMAFYQIGTDGGLLDAPVSLTRLTVSPGERVEILVDLTSYNGQTLQLMNYGSEIPSGIYGSSQPGMGPGLTANLIGYSANVLNGANYSILELQVGAPTTNPITTIPSSLITNTPYSIASANANRTLTFTSINNIVGPFQINGTSYDMSVVNQTIPMNNIEVWTLNNQSPIAHPFHIHDVQFYITDVNGSFPSANLLGRKDVILVMPMQTVTFITQFETFCDDMMPYMYHCHMLPHEDDGMMGQFIVTCPNTIDENENSGLVVYPNPANDLLQINMPFQKAIIKIVDYTGRLCLLNEVNQNEAISIGSLLKGTYILQIESKEGSYYTSFVKE